MGPSSRGERKGENTALVTFKFYTHTQLYSPFEKAAQLYAKK